jgi:hypothetical protein
MRGEEVKVGVGGSEVMHKEMSGGLGGDRTGERTQCEDKKRANGRGR